LYICVWVMGCIYVCLGYGLYLCVFGLWVVYMCIWVMGCICVWVMGCIYVCLGYGLYICVFGLWVVYMCIWVIDFSSFYGFDIWLRNCSGSVFALLIIL
jgi:hypothetical protein